MSRSRIVDQPFSHLHFACKSYPFSNFLNQLGRLHIGPGGLAFAAHRDNSRDFR
jgi:hypothetical protein